MKSKKEKVKKVISGLALVVLFATVLFNMLACSTQERTSSPQVSSGDLATFLQGFQSSTPASGTGIDLSSLNPGTEIFYAQSDQNRPPTSILSLMDVGFLSSVDANAQPGETIYDIPLASVEVAFLDTFDTNGDRLFELLIQLNDGSGNSTYFSGASQAGAYAFSNKSFSVTLSSGSGQIVLTSTDLDTSQSEELASSAKFLVYAIDGSGNQDYVGQISTLHGYSM